MSEKINTWLYWLERFNALNIGSSDSLRKLTAEELRALVLELEVAKEAGKLNTHSTNGLNNLKRIMKKHGAVYPIIWW